MTNFEFLQKYLQLQNGIMYDQLVDLGFASISFCQTDPSPFWNLALVDSLLNPNQLAQVENSFSKLGRKPAIYFEGRKDLEPLINFLENKEFKEINEDSWMFYDNRPIDQTYFDSVKKVSSETDLEIFLETFNTCYQKNDPQNPYGELGEYLKIAKSAWFKHASSGRLNYYLVYKENKPVAVSTLNNYFGIGYISNVGSLRSVRGEGFGKAATLFCVQESTNAGNAVHCLATEEGTYPNRFYSRIGFVTKFTAPLFIKAD
ncbi:hypothetical protein A3D85_00065 [Candidatus Amesbacteria bacterium RIFCSPHIGHO2_02_FULL_47_9]|uniref:N-acetyltransferase domain-containing protein n=1 Tax=Candidatus Amesbacteria bacterium RIFCSPHIGHO2_01_FULL_48_32b TaxID=1797253 RepID=A0A1F4YIL2_9BACT|nr:MAG: hypothetical protein A2876_00860 [Candidatus Amesbacteria bacterium RIFCSPHIGHO2_01_FULL_48_32b]OGD03182.1 MAG: hypothetical protein A3D85_00065 [Candidatus Amesbacteria bacterium RIFCSPHIGHO2_02_FULL_47_9]OGD07433.1 MAG: hypothetical protein A2899_03975 [Candidatus Amesbacteria bacterium RIFCSPLOWO2_01_FULL_49_25]